MSFLPICWAAQRTGLYYTPISYRLQSEEIAYIVNDYNAKLLITPYALAETFATLHSKLTNLPACFMVDGKVEGVASFESAIADRPLAPFRMNPMELIYCTPPVQRANLKALNARCRTHHGEKMIQHPGQGESGTISTTTRFISLPRLSNMLHRWLSLCASALWWDLRHHGTF